MQIFARCCGFQRVNCKPAEPKFNFKKIDLIGFRSYLIDTDWGKLANLDIDVCWNFFTKTLEEGFEKFIPKVVHRVKTQPCWLNNKCMKLIKKKYFLYKRYTQSKLHYDYQKYLETRNKTKREIRKAVKEYEKNISENCKSSSKGFWKYVNTKLKRVTGIANLTKPDNNLTTSDEEKA